MATNELHVGTSHNLLNYSGMLFNKGNTATPFSTLIGGKSRVSTSWKFPTSVEFTSEGGTSQPAITETASLTAPEPSFVGRTQESNVCQIFQETVALSYGKMSSMGSLSGLNIEGQKANPANELDFQVARKMEKINNDIEYTFLNGTYQDGNYDDTAYKTRGITSAITSNETAASDSPLTYWMVAELIKKIGDGFAPTNGLVLCANNTQIMQLNADASANGLTVMPAARNVNGLAISELVTPFGNIGILPVARVAAGTALIVNPAYLAPVHMLTPDKGNFFLEPLAKTGASDRYQIYGQLGLDYGAEWYHGKITGLSQTFTAPTYSKKVFVSGGTIEATAPAAASVASADAPVDNKKSK